MESMAGIVRENILKVYVGVSRKLTWEHVVKSPGSVIDSSWVCVLELLASCFGSIQ
jgi:hypothetical protein